jgi:rubredoxin
MTTNARLPVAGRTAEEVAEMECESCGHVGDDVTLEDDPYLVEMWDADVDGDQVPSYYYCPGCFDERYGQR